MLPYLFLLFADEKLITPKELLLTDVQLAQIAQYAAETKEIINRHNAIVDIEAAKQEQQAKFELAPIRAKTIKILIDGCKNLGATDMNECKIDESGKKIIWMPKPSIEKKIGEFNG